MKRRAGLRLIEERRSSRFRWVRWAVSSAAAPARQETLQALGGLAAFFRNLRLCDLEGGLRRRDACGSCVTVRARPCNGD